MGGGGVRGGGGLLLEMQEKGRGETTKLERGTFAWGLIWVFFPLTHLLLCFFPHQHLQGDPSWGLFFNCKWEGVSWQKRRNLRVHGRGHVKLMNSWSEKQGGSRESTAKIWLWFSICQQPPSFQLCVCCFRKPNKSVDLITLNYFIRELFYAANSYFNKPERIKKNFLNIFAKISLGIHFQCNN